MHAINNVVEQICSLPGEWHRQGSFDKTVLRAIARHVGGREIKNSVETGSGKSTLLFSHISANHTVFALDFGNSVTAVRKSQLFNSKNVTYIEGPTQLTLPKHKFTAGLQLALLDGPHAYPFPELEYYYVYPHLEKDALLILDDIHIPTLRNMFNVLREDDMFELKEVVLDTAFFVRTSAPVFNPTGDGFMDQGYNKRRFPVESFGRKGRKIARKIKHQVGAIIGR
jgi:hypothetical protein